jgi:5'-nucleotidase
MKSTNPKICLIDLDNTLCAYQMQMMADLHKLAAPDELPFAFENDPPEHIENRMSVIKRLPNWWRELPTLEDGMFILKTAVEIGFTPHILTKGPFKTTAAWEGKVLWVREKVDPVINHQTDITITQDKGLVYGRVLVDDWPPYCERWLKYRPRGLVVMPKRNYNLSYEHPQVFQFEDNADELQSKLQLAFDRET